MKSKESSFLLPVANKEEKKSILRILFLYLLSYISYLLLEGPLNLLLENFSLPLLSQGFLSNLILLLPLLLFLIFSLFRLNLEKLVTIKDKRIFLIPLAYLLFTVTMKFTAFKAAVSFDFILFLFGLCLVGFTEEFLFRGILFPKLTNAFSSVYTGAIVSSFLFGIVHYINLIRHPGSLNEITSQVIFAFCIGILMCGILYKTKDLFIPALIHAILNLEATIGTFNVLHRNEIPIINSNVVFHSSLWDILSQDWGFILFCLVLGLILICHEKRRNEKVFAGGEI